MLPSVTRKSHINTPIQAGKYLISPLTRQLQNGRYLASVSIRTGQGSATHDRVLRFDPLFDTAHAALRFAASQGLIWAGLPTAAPH
jgi:hypothetical protein